MFEDLCFHLSVLSCHNILQAVTPITHEEEEGVKKFWSIHGINHTFRTRNFDVLRGRELHEFLFGWRHSTRAPLLRNVVFDLMELLQWLEGKTVARFPQ